MKLFGDTFTAIERSLDLRMKRHSILSSNVANTETPNFRAREVDFAGELKQALNNSSEPLNQTHPAHMDVASANKRSHIVYDNTSAMGADGNNVDLDIAMGKLSSNSRAYSGATTFLTMKLRLLRFAARGGQGGI